jgi:hypothetical protein
MKFPDVSRLGSVTVPDAGHFIVLLVREDLTPGEAAGVLRGKIARARHPLDAYDAGIQDVTDAVRAALPATEPDAAGLPSDDERRREVREMIEEADRRDDAPMGSDGLADALMEIADGWARAALSTEKEEPPGG